MREAPTSFANRPFIWGSANSAYQCEGAWNEDGKGLGEWDYFNAIPHMNVNGIDGRQASDFYHRFREDIALMAQGGQNSIRLSISWSRILPEGRGTVNEEGVAFYNELIDTCIECGVEPNITLFQYDLPYAIACEGGWSNVATADAFSEYARICFERFGDRVFLWSTVDEPQYYSYCANFLGIYPPCHKLDMQSFLQWQYVQMLGSAKAIKMYHDMGFPELSVLFTMTATSRWLRKQKIPSAFTGQQTSSTTASSCTRPSLESSLPRPTRCSRPSVPTSTAFQAMRKSSPKA